MVSEIAICRKLNRKPLSGSEIELLVVPVSRSTPHGQHAGVQRIRIVLADDFEPLIETVRRLLADEFEIVGSVNNGQAAIEAVGRLDPDLLVLDIGMPNLDGFEVVARLNPSSCRTKMILLTSFSDPEFISTALARGVGGYVFKNRLVTDLPPAIREVMHGHTFVSSLPPAS